MDASDVLKKKLARMLADIEKNPTATTTKGQVPNNPPLTPSQKTMILQQYPKTDFANTNNIYPCGTATLCSTIYTADYYYNSTN
jgi:hypothetical protein